MDRQTHKAHVLPDSDRTGTELLPECIVDASSVVQIKASVAVGLTGRTLIECACVTQSVPIAFSQWIMLYMMREQNHPLGR